MIRTLGKIHLAFEAGKRIAKAVYAVCVVGAIAVAALIADLVGSDEDEDPS